MKNEGNGIVFVQGTKLQIVIGKYKTDERAKEVFKDIVKASTNDDVAIFKMPEE